MAAHLDLDGLGQQGGAQGALLGQTQQPVDADLSVESQGCQGVGARQALVAGGEELGEGRTIEPDPPGQRGLSESAPGHGLGQPAPEHLQQIAPIWPLTHAVLCHRSG